MKKANKKINAAIIVIGNEILSGRTQESNVNTISNWLNELGIKLEEVRVIPDKEVSIVKTVNEVRKKFNYIFTTGGIGPTHDDITSQSIAKAFDLSYNYHKEAFTILQKHYGEKKFNEGRRKMAKLPKNALLIYNPLSVAPGFIVDNVHCLPGVPSILKSMLGGLKKRLTGGRKILSKTLNLIAVESEIAFSLKSVQNKFKDTEIGSYPFFKKGKIGVSIVICSTEKNLITKCSKEIVRFVKQKGIKIIKRI